MKSNAINLLWTGGWDSTFRLLQLLLIEKKVVQPHYLIDPSRRSLLHEIRAQREIKNKLFREYPHTKELVLPTIFYEVGDITPDDEITKAYDAYRIIKEVDYQYSWLARYCKQFGIHDMELCIESRSGGPLPPPEMLVFTSFLVLIEGTNEAQIAEEFKGTVVQTIFKYYRFPIRGLTRQAMEAIAKKSGWQDYLYMTWFCHHPVHGRYPCGTCGPCKLVIKKGYGKRIPWFRRLYGKTGLETIRNKIAKTIHRVNPDFHHWNR